MVLGIGIDILSLTRIQTLISRRGAQTLAKRICTPTELSQLPKYDPARFLSSRWVLKEAAYKSVSSLNLDPRPSWKSFEVSHDRGAPKIHFIQPTRIETGGEVDLMLRERYEREGRTWGSAVKWKPKLRAPLKQYDV